MPAVGFSLDFESPRRNGHHLKAGERVDEQDPGLRKRMIAGCYRGRSLEDNAVFRPSDERRIGRPLSALHSQAASLENLAGEMSVDGEYQRGIFSAGSGFDDVNDIPVESPRLIASGK
jgi:hypothetical protein